MHKMTGKLCAAAMIFGLTAECALAQSFNIDFGTAAGQPDMEFPGAGAQDGFWNSIAPTPNQPVNLLGLDGQAANARVTTMMPTSGLPTDDIAGDAEALLEDGLFGNGDVVQWIDFDGLTPGTYEVLVYGFTPTRAQDVTTIIPPVGVEGLQPIGGAWPGDFQTGVTHGSFETIVSDGTLRIEYAGSFAGSQGFVNGIQLIYMNDLTTRREDVNADGRVDVFDLLQVLTAWSDGHGCDGIEEGSCPADVNRDRFIDVFDLLLVLQAWG